MKNLKKIFSIVVRISISIIMLIFLFRMVDLRNLVEHIKQARFSLVVLSFAIFSLNYILTFMRWIELFQVVNVHPPLRKLIVSFTGGIFFNLFLPSSIGGDLVRSIDLSVHTRKPREVVATVIMDRLSGYVGLMILVLCASFLGWHLIEDRTVFFSLVLLIIILTVILFVLFNPFLYERINRFLKTPGSGRKFYTSPYHKIKDAIGGVHAHLHNFRTHRKLIVKNILFSVLIQTVTPFVFYVMARSMGIHTEVVQFLILLPIIGAITLLPISIGGLGVRDAAVIFFFAKIGIGRDAAFAMSLLNFAFMAVYSVAAGIVYVFMSRTR